MDKKQRPPFGLRMPDDLKEWVKEEAQEQSRSMNNLIVHVLQEARAGDAAAQK